MNEAQEVMEILEHSICRPTLRGTPELVTCDHKAVAHWVRAGGQAAGGLAGGGRPRPAVGPFADKVEELLERSRGMIRADKPTRS